MKRVSILATICLTSLVVSSFGQAIKPANTNQNRARLMERQTRRPMTGKLVSVDKQAMTITVGPMQGATLTSNAVVQVATNTFIFKSGKKVKLDEAVPGETVRYQVRPTPDGKEVASLLILGARLTPAATPKAPAPAK